MPAMKLAALLLPLTLAACTSTAAEEPAPAEPETVVVSGSTDDETFELAGVAYTITIETQGDCFFGWQMFYEGDGFGATSFRLDPGQDYAQTTTDGPFEAGPWKLSPSTGDGCTWTMTFDPVT